MKSSFHTLILKFFHNIYASTTSGGGLEGYSQINLDPIDPIKFGSRTEVVEELGQIKTDVEIQDADPLFAEVLVNQKKDDVAFLVIL